MKGSDAKKGKHRQWLAGAVFSAALVGTCLLLFLLSDAGGALLAALGVVQTVYEPAPVSTALPETTEAPKATAAVGMEEHPALSAETFLQRAESFGMETLAVLSSEHERMAEYTLAYSSGETATLLLSLQNGEVTEFMLTMRRPMPPAPLTADANWFLQQEHDAQQAQYEESLAWIYQVFLAYALALDREEALPYSEAAQMAAAARSTFEDGEARTAEHGKFRFTAGAIPSTGTKGGETCARPHSARNHERVFLRISSNTIERSHNPLYNLGKVVHIYGKNAYKRCAGRPGI